MTSEPVNTQLVKSPESATGVQRDLLTRTYLTEQKTQELLGVDAACLRAWRKEKRLLGVWHEPVRAWLFPDFQFTNTGLIAQMPALLAVFDRHYSHVWENTWGVMEWFLSHHLLLNGQCPADLLATNPERVLQVAQIDLGEDPHTLW